MNNKAFTLVELLGVIIIIALISLIAFPNIINSIKKVSTKTDNLVYDMIYNAADIYISNHPSDFEASMGHKYIIDLSDLVAEDLLAAPIKLSNSDDDLTTTKCLQVVYIDDYTYELKNIGTCVEGLNPHCTIVDDVYHDSQIRTGDKYTCTIKTGVYFYVLGENALDSTKVDLIMDRNYTDSNVPMTVRWCKSGSTNDCTPNITRYATYIQEAFDADEEYVTVSIPTKAQIEAAYTESMPIWLYDYLSGTTHPVSNSYGYWTASINTDYSNYAWFVYCIGDLSSGDVDYSVDYGVRPVITISKSLMN